MALCAGTTLFIRGLTTRNAARACLLLPTSRRRRRRRRSVRRPARCPPAPRLVRTPSDRRRRPGVRHPRPSPHSHAYSLDFEAYWRSEMNTCNFLVANDEKKNRRFEARKMCVM